MARGVFDVEDSGEEFNIKPKEIADPIPDDQRELNHDIYETWNILKLLKEGGVFKSDDTSFAEYRTRLLEAANIGLTANYVKSKLASDALAQIQRHIVKRKGRTMVFGYLAVLVLWAIAGAGIGIAIVLAAKFGATPLSGYGWVIVGSMAGAWLSLAAARRKVDFYDLPGFLDTRVEPMIRMLFVAAIAVAFAFLLQIGFLTLTVTGVEFAKFCNEASTALFLGLVAGIGERALSVQVIERVSRVTAPSSS